MSVLLDSLERSQRAPAPRQYPGPQPATVLEATADGLLVEPDIAPGSSWGPCAWGPRPSVRDDNSHLPAPGTRCLVLHASAGLDRPWVVALDWTAP